MSVAYMQSPSNFVSWQVFPVIPVEFKSDKYFTYNKGDWFRDLAHIRAPGDRAAVSGYNLTQSGPYSCEIYALAHKISDPERANYDSPLSADTDAVNWLSRNFLMRQEQQWVTNFFTSGNSIWGSNEGAPAGGLWDTPTGTPIDDVLGVKNSILSTTGFEPNVGVISYPVYLKLRRHPDVLDQYKYTTAGVVTADMLARLFDLDKLLVAKSVINTANEGAASDSLGYVLGKHMLVAYVPPQAGLRTPAAGYTFMWRGVSGGMGENVGIKRFRWEIEASDYYEGQIAFDMKVIGSDLGYLLTSVIS
jgi:hypothetical protein